MHPASHTNKKSFEATLLVCASMAEKNITLARYRMAPMVVGRDTIYFWQTQWAGKVSDFDESVLESKSEIQAAPTAPGLALAPEVMWALTSAIFGKHFFRSFERTSQTSSMLSIGLLTDVPIVAMLSPRRGAQWCHGDSYYTNSFIISRQSAFALLIFFLHTVDRRAHSISLLFSLHDPNKRTSNAKTRAPHIPT